MSINVTLTQKGLLKKKLPIHVIMGENLCTYDKIADKSFIAYDPGHIGRGIIIELSDKEKTVSLTLPSPAAPEETEDFFNTVKRISEFTKCQLSFEGENKELSEFLSMRDEIQLFNDRVLSQMLSIVTSGETDRYTFPSVKYNLTIGVEEAESFSANHTKFFRWLHEKQSTDAYFAKPQFFNFKGDTRETVGIYSFIEDTVGVYPCKPRVPFGINDNETGKPFECDTFKVSIYSITEKATIGMIEYDVFLNEMLKHSERFDAESFITEKMPLAVLKQLANDKAF